MLRHFLLFVALRGGELIQAQDKQTCQEVR